MRPQNKRYFNIDAVLKALLLFGFAAFFLHTVITGSVNQYVHPRIIPYLIFAAIVMDVIAVLSLGKLFTPYQKMAKGTWGLLFFAVPLLMAFTLSPESLSASTGTIGDVQLSMSGMTSKSDEIVQESTSPEPSAAGNTAQNEAGQESESPENSDGTIPNAGTAETAPNEEEEENGDASLQSDILVMDSSNYYECLCDIYADMDKYEGMPVEVTGFVFRDSSFSDDEFVPARLLMVCCAADMETVGPLCRYDKALELESDSWVKVSGTIEKIQFDGETIPCIAAQDVEPVNKPNDAYVYPY
ncbi:MAG: TIGR03943 family protein [Oscillospiraceae bacterium]